MIDRITRLAGWYGLPMQVQKAPEPEQGLQKTSSPEREIRPVSPRQPVVPREEWMKYAELREQIRLLRCPYPHVRKNDPR
ncbi:hypothetical protein EV586_102652 [Tumebacillus sp. BK434]|uniref:hypothetical protein n=1 Tax=Tumebacillus sp. BK434 TaxID=2512169 RepID=UPI001052E1F3|nr:hypothetical protein [Tumebacillus sp. BK434]TCP58199.1 hypothetical protein EV586_102652 [Tumebacillus sp. BK434]